MSNINVMRKNLGPVTAYKYAVQQGYTGTEQEFAVLMASYATVAETATQAADDAIDAKTAAEAAQAAAEAAAEQAEGAIEVDDTLSVRGRAADAKATGDALNKFDEVIPNFAFVFSKADLRIGGLQPNNTVDSTTHCLSNKTKISLSSGEKLVIKPSIPNGDTAKIRIVVYTNPEMDNTAGVIKVNLVDIPADGYLFTMPSGYSYILFCIYYYTDGSIHSGVADVFDYEEEIVRATYTNKKEVVATDKELNDLTTLVSDKAETEDVIKIAESLSAQKTMNANGCLLFEPMTLTSIEASENCTFTGRNLFDILGKFDASLYPTKNNGKSGRGFWGSDIKSIVSPLNELPPGKYTASVSFLLESLNGSYDGTTAQTGYLYLTFVTSSYNIRTDEIDISDRETGDIIRLSIQFELTESTAGTITNFYMYLPQSNITTQKWKCRIIDAQIESGDLTDYVKYTEKTGTNITAYDYKMSANFNGDYVITYNLCKSRSVLDGENIEQYFQSEVEDCRNKLEVYCSEKALVYMIVTDTHVHNDAKTKKRWKDTVSNIKAVNKAYQCDALIHLGDMINGSLPESESRSLIRMIRDDMRSVIEPNFILVGNHDTNTFYGANMDEPITEAEMYGLWERYNEKDVTQRPNGKPYWYKDYNSFGIRVIFLSSSMGDGTHGGQGGNWGFPAAEIEWFRDDALDTKLQVLMFSHMPFTRGFISYAYTLPQNGDIMIEILSNFINNGGTVIGLINGHTHFDYSFNNGYFQETSLGCESITNNTSDLHGDDITTQFTAPDDAVRYGRMDGTLTQDLWSILAVRPGSKTAKIIRFGAGEDIEWSY